MTRNSDEAKAQAADRLLNDEFFRDSMKEIEAATVRDLKSLKLDGSEDTANMAVKLVHDLQAQERLVSKLKAYGQAVQLKQK